MGSLGRQEDPGKADKTMVRIQSRHGRKKGSWDIQDNNTKALTCLSSIPRTPLFNVLHGNLGAV